MWHEPILCSNGYGVVYSNQEVLEVTVWISREEYQRLGKLTIKHVTVLDKQWILGRQPTG
jgi:hypothetical protein